MTLNAQKQRPTGVTSQLRGKLNSLHVRERHQQRFHMCCWAELTEAQKKKKLMSQIQNCRNDTLHRQQ